MLARGEFEHPDRLALQVANRADPLGPEEFEAPGVAACKDDHGVTSIDLHEEPRVEVHVHTGFPGRQRCLDPFDPGLLDVLKVREALGPEERFGHELGRLADGGGLNEPEPRRLRRRLCGDRPGVHAKKPCRPREC